MPAPKNRSKAQQNPYPNFIELKLTEDQKNKLKIDEDFKSKWWWFFDAISQQDLKFTLKWDDKTNCAQAMLQSNKYDPDVAANIWVMRSSGMVNATLKLAYYFSLADGVLPDPRTRADIEDEDFLL